MQLNPRSWTRAVQSIMGHGHPCIPQNNAPQIHVRIPALLDMRRSEQGHPCVPHIHARFTQLTPRSRSCAAFQTRMYTPGAARQIPRKIPLRLEPKTHFANERTFLAWSSIAITFGASSTVLSSLDALTPPGATHKSPVSPQQVAGVNLFLAPLALIILAYALFTYWNRVTYMRGKATGFYNDRMAPVCIAGLIGGMLLALTAITYISYFSR